MFQNRARLKHNFAGMLAVGRTGLNRHGNGLILHGALFVVVHQLESLNERIRDVRVGPDGYVYVLTDGSNGRLLKLGL